MGASVVNRIRPALVALALLLAAGAFSAAVVLPAYAYADDVKAQVERISKSGESYGLQKYASISDAFDEVKAWGKNSNTAKVTIDLYDDFNSNDYGILQFVEGKEYVLNLHGHMINRDESDSSYYGGGDGQVIYVKGGSSLTINGGSTEQEKLISHGGYLVKDENEGELWQDEAGNDSCPIAGGLITGGACDSSATAGGIAVSGDGGKLYLNDVTIAGNVADTNGWKSSSGYAGGVAIWGANSVLEMSNSKIVYNHSELDGGGLYVCRKSKITLDNGSEISHNSAIRNGGGVFIEGNEAELYVKGRGHSSKTPVISKIDCNRSKENGAGVTMHGENAVLELDGGEINDNNTPAKGGGVYASYKDTTVRMKSNAQISRNRCGASSGGAGIYADEKNFKLSMDGSQMTDNSECAVRVEKGDATLEVLNNSELSGNSHSAIRSAGTNTHLTFKDSTVKKNSVIAAIYITGDNTTIDVDNSTFCNNDDTWYHGGAFGLEGKTTLNLKNSKIHDNSATSGGGIYCTKSSTINLDNSYIYNNTAKRNSNGKYPVGGGISFYKDSSGTMAVNMTNGSSIYNNTGGGIFSYGYDLRVVSDDHTGTIRDNTSQMQFWSLTYAHNGGGICSYDGTLYVEGISITGNKIGGDGWYYGVGGGIYSQDNSFTLKDVTITGNVARSGGGLYFESSKYRDFTLQGKVIIDDNETLYRWRAWWAETITETGVSNVYLSCPDQQMCGGDGEGNYLDPSSHIGISGETSSLPRRVSGNQAFMTKLGDDYSKVLFSDADNRAIELDGNYLYLKSGQSRFDLTLKADGGTSVKENIGRSNKVQLKSADYPKYIDPDDPSKGTYLLDYWTLESPSAVTKTVKASAGTTEFFMPYGDTVATAHYTTDATGVQLGLTDSNEWDKLGTKENVSVSALTLTSCMGKQVTVPESLLKNVAVEGCSSADGKDSETGLKKVTYTIKVPASVFDELGLPVSSERVSSAVAAVASELGDKEDSSCKVQAADGGIKITATVTMGEQRTVTVTGVDVNKVSSGQAAQIEGATTSALVADGGTVTLATPVPTGWNFTAWSTSQLPDGVTIEEQTESSITLGNVTSDVNLGVLYEPYVSAIDVGVAVPSAGKALPTTFTSCRVTGTSFSGLDVTKSVNKYGLSVVWKKYGSDEALPDDYTAVEGEAYVATATVTLGESGGESDEVAYSYAFTNNVSVAVNGIAAITQRDTGAKKAVVTFTLTTGKAKAFDHVVTDLSDVEVAQVADSSAYLPSSIEIALDASADKTANCDVTWDAAGNVSSGEFTVTGKFSYGGSEYDVSRNFRLTRIGAPTASVESGACEKGQEVKLSAGSGWKAGTGNAIKYCLVQGDDAEPAADASYSDYSDEAPVTLDSSGTWTLFVYGQVGDRTTSVSRYIYEVGTSSLVVVDGGEAYVNGERVSRASAGDVVTIKADKPAERQSFKSWEVKGNCGVELDDASASTTTFTMPDERVWVEATYEASAYLVSFDTGVWGADVDAQEVKVGGKATKPADPTCAGRTFKGWYVDTACTQAYDFSSEVTSNITLHAKWEAIEHSVTFDSAGGSAVEDQTVADGECAKRPKDPVRSGYSFEGWRLDGEPYTFTEPVAGDLALTASWRADEGTSTSIAGAQVKLSKTEFTYVKGGCKPTVTVTLGGKTLKAGTDYDLSYQNSNQVGTATAVIVGRGSYSGTLGAAYQIVPAKVKSVSVKKAGKGKAKVKWAKHKDQTSGFELRYATSKAKLKAGKVKTVRVKGASKKTAKLKKLKRGKKVYVQVRAYKVVNGKIYRSSWSNIAKVKVK
ncbi:MAG: InlB B-repeat-containing protein [Coriobacteriia bacterium]|nr:InlB B-repeat-containing protein [Coriobacteriia bacterium]